MSGVSRAWRRIISSEHLRCIFLLSEDADNKVFLLKEVALACREQTIIPDLLHVLEI